MFTTFRSFETVKPHIAEIERYATEAGREVGVLTTTHVVCRETEAEAHQYYRFYAEENADADAVTFHQRMKEAHYGAVEPDVMQLERRRYAGGTGSYPLVGTPEQIADEMIAMHKLGLAGVTVSPSAGRAGSGPCSSESGAGDAESAVGSVIGAAGV